MNTIKPYVNFVSFKEGEIIELHWCHGAISKAQTAYRLFTGRDETIEYILNNRLTEEHSTISLFYGAMSEATGINFSDFGKLYNKDIVGNITNIQDCMLAVIDGVFGYWLEDKEKKEKELDELDLLYPEIETKKEEGESLYFLPLQIEMLKAGFTVADIEKMTMRGSLAVINIIRGVKSSSDSDWLDKL